MFLISCCPNNTVKCVLTALPAILALCLIGWMSVDLILHCRKSKDTLLNALIFELKDSQVVNWVVAVMTITSIVSIIITYTGCFSNPMCYDALCVEWSTNIGGILETN